MTIEESHFENNFIKDENFRYELISHSRITKEEEEV